jgi:1,4-alpha-glucan branching enzyme
MDSRLGAWQVGNDSLHGAVQFKLFFPNGPDPRISSIRVCGSFQDQKWDFLNAPQMTRSVIDEGALWSYTTPVELPADFYEYKYLVTFDGGERRWVSDPCTRYGGSENQNAAFVIGGSDPAVAPLAHGRKPLRDLVVYELHLDDFTDDFRRTRAPMDAVRDKLDDLVGLGVNAILFMPWTTWQNRDFDWGYTPFQYFAAEYRYVNDVSQPAEKLSALANLISACHQRDIHVIMDGVFNHVHPDFPYQHLYQTRDDCPFTATPFGGTFTGLQDLDFLSPCTRDFIRDVCTYWIDAFGIDGIRFDNTVNYHVAGDARGIPDLLQDIQDHLEGQGSSNFSLTLEHLSMDAASLVNGTQANSFWDNSLYQHCFDSLWSGGINPSLLDTLNNQRYLADPAKAPTLYLSNHDHSHVAWQAGARDNRGGFEWYRTQPYAIALMTAPGVPMLQSGQEFAEDHWIPEDDGGTGRRVRPRPLRWPRSSDSVARAVLRLYARLGAIRQQYPALRSTNFYPDHWDDWQTRFNPAGFGLDTERQVVVFHRWGQSAGGVLQRFYVVLNFSAEPQWVSVPFPENGPWTDVLANFDGSWTPIVADYHLDVQVGAYWGHIFYREG